MPTTGTLLAFDTMTPAMRRRAVIAATLGNGLEFYDFITFAFFAIQIGHTFFPSHSSFVSLMAALATFGAGFITRPIGAQVLGGYADRHGRKPAMLISMSMMGGGILLLALTPSYASIGIAAPALALCARLIQGFALGGEVGCATTYMMESALSSRRGLTVSWQGASQAAASTFGALVGVALTYAFGPAELETIGWRIALVIGASIVPVALYVRGSLPETLHVTDPSTDKGDARLGDYLRPVVCGFLIIASGTIGQYIFQYMATYGQNTLALSARVSMAGEFTNNGMQFVVVLIGGWLSDKYGRKSVMVLPQALFCALVVPCFYWLVTGRDALSFMGANLVLGASGSLMYGAVYAAISESLPRQVRARVFALVYSIPVAVFGGTTQMVVTWLLRVTGSPMTIAWYLTAVSLVGLGAMIAMRESAPCKLRPTETVEIPLGAQPA